MRRSARRGGARAITQQNDVAELYLDSPKMYLDAHCDHSLSPANVSSETTQHTQWAPSACELHRRARALRCTHASSDQHKRLHGT